MQDGFQLFDLRDDAVALIGDFTGLIKFEERYGRFQLYRLVS